jgi:type IV secretory pathway VirB10-like protein
MFSNRLAFAALGVACVAAAAGGSYLATRHNVGDVAAPPAQAAAAPAPASQPVQETEAIVGDTAKPSAAPAPAAPATSAAPSTPAKRGESSARPNTRPSKTEQATARNKAQQPPALDRSWPSSSSSSTTPAATPSVENTTPARTEDHQAEPARAPEPPVPSYEELVVSSGSVIGLQNETALSSERARVEDKVEARVTRDVRVGGTVAIPAGTRALGSVVVVERGGKFKERARLGIRFHTLALADGTRLPISTETIYREGDAPGNSSAAKIGGGAVAGAILGAIIGGGKGAAVGAATGAGGGTAVVMAGDRSAATFPAGAEVTARVLSPVTVTVQK